MYAYIITNTNNNTRAEINARDIKKSGDTHTWCGIEFDEYGRNKQYNLILERLDLSARSTYRLDQIFGVIREVNDSAVTLALSNGEYRHVKYSAFIREVEPITGQSFAEACAFNGVYMTNNCEPVRLDENQRYYVKYRDIEYLCNFEKFTASHAAMFRLDSGDALVIPQFAMPKIIRL
jgi:hypothetical protein